MKTIKKTLNVQSVHVSLYDRDAKAEKEIDCTIMKGSEIPVPPGCVVLDKTVISEGERRYTMPLEDFFKNAKPE